MLYMGGGDLPNRYVCVAWGCPACPMVSADQRKQDTL